MRTHVIRVAVLGTLCALLAGVGCKKQKPKPPEPDPEFEQLRSNLVHAALVNLMAPPANHVTWTRAAQPAQAPSATELAAQPAQPQPPTPLAAQPAQPQSPTPLAAEVSRSSAEQEVGPDQALAVPAATTSEPFTATPSPEQDEQPTRSPKAKPITVPSPPSQPNSAIDESQREDTVASAQESAEPAVDNAGQTTGGGEEAVEAKQATNERPQGAPPPVDVVAPDPDQPQPADVVVDESQQQETQKAADQTEVAVRRAISSAFSARFGAGSGFTGDTAGANGFTGIGAGPGHTGVGAGPGSTGIGAGPGHTGVGAGPGYTGVGAGRGFTGVSAGDWGFTGIAGSRAPESTDVTSTSLASSPTLAKQGSSPNQGNGAIVWLTPWGLVLLPAGAR